jgi:hypothetical protein
MSGFLFVVSLILLVVGGVMLLVEAFGESLLWGLGCLFLSFPVALIFIITHWSQSKKAVALQVAGWILFFLAAHSGAQ